MTQPNSPFAEKEIPEIAFDIAEVMPEWYKCECDGNRSYYANKATKFFQKKVQSLLQEIREEVIGFPEFPIKDPSPNERLIGSIVEQQRKNLKTIKERYL